MSLIGRTVKVVQQYPPQLKSMSTVLKEVTSLKFLSGRYLSRDSDPDRDSYSIEDLATKL